MNFTLKPVNDNELIRRIDSAKDTVALYGVGGYR